MQIYNVYQSGKRLYIDEKEIPDNKIVVNKYDNMQQTLRLISDGTLPPRLYWALRNPKLSNKYFILKLVNNKDLIVGTDISATPGLWDMLLIGTDENYIIEGADIDQSRLTYVSDHFGRLFVRDNFLEELDFEEQCSPTFKVFYDEIMFRLDNIPDLSDIPDKMSDLENDTNFISGVAFKDDGQGNVKIIGTTFGGETEEGGGGSGGNIEVDDKLDETSTNPVQNKVVAKKVNSLKEKDESLDKEVKALQERNAKLEETIEKLQIKTTTSPSPFHHITDSANMKVVDFGMEGKTGQETTPGNQLFDKDSIAILYGLLQNNGSAISNNNYVHTDFIEVVSNETYTVNVFNSTYNYSGVWIYDENKTFVSKVESSTGITIPENAKYVMIGFVKSVYGVFTEAEMLELSESIMLVKGSTKPTTYEPYTNGPSPNPDYPQEIVNAGVYNEATGRYEIGCRVENQNLFVVPLLISGTELSQSTGVVIESDMYYASDYIATRKSSYKYIAFCSELTKKRIVFYDKNKKYVNGFGTNNTNFFATIPSDAEFFRYSFYCEDIENITEKKTVVERTKVNTIASEYVEGKGQNFTLTSPVPLTKWDKLIKRDGVWGWRTFDKEYEVTGYESFNTGYEGYYTGSSTNMYFNSTDITKKATINTQYIYCEELSFVPSIWSKMDGSVGMNTNGAQLHIRLPNKLLGVSDDSTKEDKNNAYRNYLRQRYTDGNPLKLLYKVDTEQSFHPLPDEEQTLLNNLETYYGVTNLYNDQGCPMWISYISHPQLYVDQKLEQINNALLSLGANV